MANKLLKLIEQADLYNKDLNFKEFSEIMNTDYEIEKNLKIDNSEDYEDMESYRQKKRKYKKKEDNEEGYGYDQGYGYGYQQPVPESAHEHPLNYNENLKEKCKM